MVLAAASSSRSVKRREFRCIVELTCFAETWPGETARLASAQVKTLERLSFHESRFFLRALAARLVRVLATGTGVAWIQDSELAECQD